MRHSKTHRKFGLKKGPRRAFLRILASNFVQYEKIRTTEAKAKELRKIVERFITYGKKQDLSSLRLLLSKVSKPAAYKIYNELAPRYKERKGGYTRITKEVKRRTNDGSEMAVIEFV